MLTVPNPRFPQMRWLAVWLAAALAMMLLGALLGRGAQAQDLEALAREKLKERIAEEPEEEALPATEAKVIETEASTAEPIEDVSRIEELFSERSGAALWQFGYETFTSPSDVTLRQSGAVQEGYFLGPGDEIIVNLRGQENAQYRQRVSRNGQIVLPRLKPILAAGRTFGDFRGDLIAEVERSFTATDVYVALGEIRQVSVLVAGEVHTPGTVTLTGLSSPVDALILAGGVEKTGSLRRIRVIRGEKALPVDLYTLLMGLDGPADFNLQEGDRIIVPPLGATVAVAGAVKRQAVYELGRAGATNASDLVTLAGGPEVRGKYRYTLLHTDGDGVRRFSDVTDLDNTSVRDGDILLVHHAVDQAAGEVELMGHSLLTGTYSLADRRTMRALLQTADSFKPGPYLPFGAVSRRDPVTFARALIAFSPAQAMRDTADLPLQDHDIVRVLSIAEVRALAKAATSLDLLDAERLSGKEEEDAGTAFDQLAKELLVDPRAVAVFLSEYLVSIHGSVRVPGPYLATSGTTLAGLAGAAGGFTGQTELDSAEITSTRFDSARRVSETLRRDISLKGASLDAIHVAPHDAVVLRDVFAERRGGMVAVSGEVRFPGAYEVMQGERLSSLLARAGGLTDAAFPEGALFQRRSVAVREHEGNRRKADDLQTLIVAQSTRREFTADQLAFIEKLVVALRELPPTGRIAIEADPDILAARPELDIELEPGDTLRIPSRPATVTVTGQVLNPGSYQYVPGKSASYYIALAGEANDLADKDRAFAVYPDGSSRRLSGGFLSFRSARIAPGTVIVMPFNVSPFHLSDFIRDAAQIVTQTTITGASVYSFTK